MIDNDRRASEEDAVVVLWRIRVYSIIARLDAMIQREVVGCALSSFDLVFELAGTKTSTMFAPTGHRDARHRPRPRLAAALCRV